MKNNIMKIGMLSAALAFIMGMTSGCGGNNETSKGDSESKKDTTIKVSNSEKGKKKVSTRLVDVVDTGNLRIYYPHFSKIDLVCGSMPQKNNGNVIMIAEAAFTGDLLDTFNHSNIAGDHVSGGKRYKGYRCKRNNGAFVYYQGKPKFLHKNYSEELDKAAKNGGCGFAQEMMIHQGKEVAHTRSDSNSNEFRALCLIDDKVCVADSKGSVTFRDFIDNLLAAGATEALYLDMGPGWNYSWYRDESGQPVEIHPSPTEYATNWITFYR